MRTFTKVFFLTVFLFAGMTALNAQTAEIGYGASTSWGTIGTTPSITSSSGATESLTSGAGGTIKNATVCGSAKDHYEIGSNAYYLEGSVTDNSASSSITSIILEVGS